MAEKFKYIIQSITGAAPGWRAVYRDASKLIEQPVAVWAICRVEAPHTAQHTELIVCGIVANHAGMSPAEETSNLVGYAGPGIDAKNAASL